MEQLSTEDIDADRYELATALHIPTEVCENIIDMLYSRTYIDTTREHIATLHSCALVCRSWRVRSQRMLFYRVQLSNSTSLHRLYTVLDAAKHLRDYVYEVELTGHHLHNTTSILALFPAVFAGKLPNLCQLEIVHLVETSEIWFPRTPEPPKSRPLPYIPLHLRFPTFLSSFTAVSFLHVESTTFRSFSEFARMLHGLPNLKTLGSNSVRWIAPGGSHPDADFTKHPDWPAGRCALPPFAPSLRGLGLWDMDVYGVERLIWTRGPHLIFLGLTIPLLVSPEKFAPAIQQGIDLGSCTGIQTLTLLVCPQFSMDQHVGFVKELLASWRPQHVDATLRFRPYRQFKFTRRDFADALRSLATIIEAFKAPASAGESENKDHVQYRLEVRVHDGEAEKEWWWDHVAGCFPTWLQLRRLHLVVSPSLDEADEWAPEEQLAQSDTYSEQSEIESVASSARSQSQDALPSLRRRSHTV